MELTLSFLEKKKFPRSRKNEESLAKAKKGQMKIQQMSFMLIAVFIFFALVGLFFVRIQLGNFGDDISNLEKEQAISSLSVISDMPELNCESGTSLCFDEDKLRVMGGGFGENYREFWPVESIKVYKVYPAFDREIKCPQSDCNYYEVYDSGQVSSQEYSTFVSICSRIKEDSYHYDKCEIGKLVVGVRVLEGVS